MEQYKGQIETMFEKHIYLSEIEQTITEMDENLLGFLTSKSSTKLNDYNIGSQRLEGLFDKNGPEIFNRNDLIMKNIHNLSDAYLDFGEAAISDKRQRNVFRYYENYKRSKEIKTYILDYIDSLNNLQLSVNSLAYLDLVDQIYLLQTITIVIIVILIIISLIVVYLITSRMARPFGQLGYAAEEISKGNFDTDDIHIEHNDEFKLLAIAFNKMKNNIKEHIDELKYKAEMEARLKDEQLKNIRMEHLLDSARLYALQSQINPHFLFNTINAGVQMSIMERATRTGQFLESMSRLFRYNIQKMDSVCSLDEEIKNISDYYDLLKVRFGHRIRFDLEVDPRTLDKRVPPLILQPMVENAYVHGLSGIEEGGTIKVSTSYSDEEVLVVIEDDGRGLDKETIAKILSRETPDQKELKNKIREQGGIGVKNVRDRLELFFHKNDIMEIEGEPNGGVRILMHLPNQIVE